MIRNVEYACITLDEGSVLEKGVVACFVVRGVSGMQSCLHRNCSVQPFKFLEYVTSQIDNGNPVDVIYLDFQKSQGYG